MIRLLLLASFLAIPLVAPSAQTMRTDAQPVAGTMDARPDRPSAMLDLTIRAVDASGMEECMGLVDPSAPDAIVQWPGGDLDIYTRAAADATLLVYGPDQQWHCNDDSEGLSPRVSLQNAPQGRYIVWVGAFSADLPDLRATLIAGAPGQAAPQADPQGQPAAGRLELHGGFEGNTGAVEQAVNAGGMDAIASMDLSLSEEDMMACPGYVTADHPTVVVEYMADGPGSIAFAAEAEADLAMLIHAPDGSWHCNDDYNGLSPVIGFEEAEGGSYAVWVATYGSMARGVATPATLTVSETIPEQESFDGGDDFDGDMGNPMPYSTGTYSPLQLDGRPSVSFALTDNGPVSAQANIAPYAANPVRGDACYGLIEPNPTAALTLTGDGPVAITATADQDLIMTVRTPSGSWFCSDDADGLNPGVQIDDVERGVYHVWVGAFAEITDGSLEVEVSATRGELQVSAVDDEMPGGGDFPFFEEATYSGSELSSGASTTTLQFDGAGRAEATVAAGGDVLNPVEAGSCQGFISNGASATIEVYDGDSLSIAASAEEDLTMIVQGADGTWYCSDDADGSDPMVSIQDSPAGGVLIWVGTFSNLDQPVNATLSVVR